MDDQQRRADILRTIEERAFELVYQPIMAIDTGRLIGVETLCRFRDGRSPQRWFDDADRLGLATELDLAIIDSALADLPELPEGYLALNVAPATIVDRRLLDLLRSVQVPRDRFVVEMTEHAKVANYPQLARAVDCLRAEGVRLAIDDAGAGYATFRHAVRLGPDIIKMDQSITQHINEDPARLALATALVIFAGEMGAALVAEGVETESELATLLAAGISRAQGFALARPMSLPLVLPGRGVLDSAAVRAAEPPPSLPTWASVVDNVAVGAHRLLSPVGGIEVALELLGRKLEPLGEDECTALVAAARRQTRMVGQVLHSLARGLAPDTVLVLDDLATRVHDGDGYDGDSANGDRQPSNVTRLRD